MNSLNNKPILVTGSHRSGSTWTGRMIAHEPSIAYIHEPFNLNHRPGICKAHFDYQFPYICNENESLYLSDINDCITFKYNLIEELKAAKSYKDFLRLIRDYIFCTSYRILKKRALVKDPIAVFSTEWLANRFNMNVVVVIRHPAAFVNSIRNVKWSHPFDHFLQQPLLMKHHLHKYKAEITEFSKSRKDIIDQAILLWNLIHYMILNYKNKHNNWIFIKHEDLSTRPIIEFKNIFNQLNLNFTRSIENKIKSFSFCGNLSNNKHQKKIMKQIWYERVTGNYAQKRKRNSKSNIWNWKKQLTKYEIIKIEEKTRDIAKNFYNEDDWIG